MLTAEDIKDKHFENRKSKTKRTIPCYHCGRDFQRSQADIAYNAKKGHNNYCSKECANQFFPFKRHLSEAARRARDKGLVIDIKLEDLEKQWEKQKGVCPYSGYKLRLREKSGVAIGHLLEKASLDRIDASKGYTRDNIQWVSAMAQYAKNTFTSNELIKFCTDVVKYQIKKRALSIFRLM